MVTAMAAQNWALFVLRGVLALIFGVVAFVAPGPTFAALIFVFAFYAIVDGVFAVALGLSAPGGPRWLLVLGGIIGVAIGIYTGFNPSITATALVILIGAFVLVRGAAEVGAGIAMRSVIQDAWLVVLSGIVSIAFGAYLLVVPADGALALVYVVGFYALFAGVMYIAAGVQLRNLLNDVQAVAQSAQAAGSRPTTQSPQATQTTGA
jgi:uncharacterized membrane protein HdeD (DUF308 family)